MHDVAHCRTASNSDDKTNTAAVKKCITMDEAENRISPLRGGMSQHEIVTQTKIVKNGLSALRDDHYTVLANIRDEYENQKNDHNYLMTTTTKDQTSLSSPTSKNGGCRVKTVLEERITNVTKSLEQLEVGIAESNVLLSLHDHFERLEADRSTLRLEMGRVQDENEWLREELTEMQRQVQEALAELAELKEEKKQWQFQEEIRLMSEIKDVRPVTPSKIPVGSWRVEEEKDVNRALSGIPMPSGAGTSRSRATSPAPSRIPVGGWRNKLSVYKSVMEKQEAAANEKKKTSNNVRKGNSCYKLNAPRPPKIPTSMSNKPCCTR